MNLLWRGSKNGSRKEKVSIGSTGWNYQKEFGGMRFRHLHGFDLIMPEKQVWKFSTNLDAKVTKAFKAKYFPNGGFLEAPLGHNPSYIWCSIQASQTLVKEDMRWRVGDGLSINIWHNHGCGVKISIMFHPYALLVLNTWLLIPSLILSPFLALEQWYYWSHF